MAALASGDSTSASVLASQAQQRAESGAAGKKDEARRAGEKSGGSEARGEAVKETSGDAVKETGDEAVNGTGGEADKQTGGEAGKETGEGGADPGKETGKETGTDPVKAGKQKKQKTPEQLLKEQAQTQLSRYSGTLTSARALLKSVEKNPAWAWAKSASTLLQDAVAAINDFVASDTKLNMACIDDLEVVRKDIRCSCSVSNCGGFQGQRPRSW